MRTEKNGCASSRRCLKSVFLAIICLSLTAVFSACSSRMGWGVLLWSTEEPPVQSGTVLPVYIRSNINRVWVLGTPPEIRTGRNSDRFEVPLERFEFVGRRSRANERAEQFSRYALVYAETLQDRLPIREAPNNQSRQVYRLREGDIIKILYRAEGVPPLSASGAPLPGEWFRVLTPSGISGYCFSFRLRIFEHHGGELASSVPAVFQDAAGDPDLDRLVARRWSPESYLTMFNSRRFSLEDLVRRWHFDPGQETGVARLSVQGLERTFSHNGIVPTGNRSWRFEGTNLSMQMRTDNLLAVQFSEGGGITRTFLFVSLPVTVDELITQETARRNRMFNEILRQGPAFTSNNFGTITFREGGEFTWTGFDLLVPHIIPAFAEGRGTIQMDLFLTPVLENRFTGAFTMRFAGGHTGGHAVLRSMYYIDDLGFRVEIVPEINIENITVTRSAASPMVMYFYRDLVPPAESPLE